MHFSDLSNRNSHTHISSLVNIIYFMTCSIIHINRQLTCPLLQWYYFDCKKFVNLRDSDWIWVFASYICSQQNKYYIAFPYLFGCYTYVPFHMLQILLVIRWGWGWYRLYLVDDSESGRGRSPNSDTESETRFNPYHHKTEPSNIFIIPNTIMSLQTKQKHNIDNSV